MKALILSLFYGSTDTVPKEIALPQLAEMIRCDQSLQTLTRNHRTLKQAGRTAEADHAKKSLPCFAVAVRLAGGKSRKHVAAYSSLSMVDIDHIPVGRLADVRRVVNSDPHTLLSFVTASGCGLRVIFRYAGNPLSGTSAHSEQVYKRIFESGNAYYRQLTGLETDRSCCNPTRLSFLAHDPEVCFRPEAVPFSAEELAALHERGKRKPGRPSRKQAVSAAEAAKVIGRELERRNIAYRPGHHNEYIMQALYLMNRYGVPAEEAEAWAVERFADYGEQAVRSIVRSCYQQTEEHGTLRLPKYASEVATVSEIEEFILSRMEVRFNVVTFHYEMRRRNSDQWVQFQDRDLNSLWRDMKKHVKPVFKNDMENIIMSDFSPRFNPFEEYIGSLPGWDGVTDHIDRLAASIRVKGDELFFRRAFKKWFVAFIAAIFDPEEINHEILVFIGRQGTYKSTFFHYLLPPPLRQYFYAKLMEHHISKDDLFKISQAALVCLEEIDNMRQKELNQLKALTTMRSINERRAYGRFCEYRPHISSFCATGNNLLYLNDQSGNRRFLSFEVLHIPAPQTYPYNYEGMYAQAYALWKGGFRYWFDAEENEELNEHNRDFESPNKEKDLISKYFRQPLPGEKSRFMTATDILERINVCIKESLSVVRIGNAMRSLGYERWRSGNQRGYKVIEIQLDEIERKRTQLAQELSDIR